MGTIFHLQSSLKRFLFPLLVITFFHFTMYGQNPSSGSTFHIQGKIEHFGNGILVGSVISASTGKVTMDTIHIEKDVFSHRCSIEHQQIVSYVVPGDRFSVYRNVLKDGDSVHVDFADKRLKAIEVVAFAGADIKINGEASGFLAAYPSGDLENNILASISRQRDPLLSAISHLDYSNKKEIRLVLQQEDIWVDSIRHLENRCVTDHPGSMVASYIILDRFRELNKSHPAKADSLLYSPDPSSK